MRNLLLGTVFLLTSSQAVFAAETRVNRNLIRVDYDVLCSRQNIAMVYDVYINTKTKMAYFSYTNLRSGNYLQARVENVESYPGLFTNGHDFNFELDGQEWVDGTTNNRYSCEDYQEMKDVVLKDSWTQK